MLKNYDKKLDVMCRVLEANRNRGGLTYSELTEILIIMFEYKYNRSNSPLCKRLIKRNQLMENPYQIDENLIKNAKRVNFKTSVVIPSEIQAEYTRNKKKRLKKGLDDQLIEMLEALRSFIEQNEERGVTRKEAELFLRRVFKKKSLRIEKVICFGKFYGKPIERKNWVKTPKEKPLVIPNDYREKYEHCVDDNELTNVKSNVCSSSKLFLDSQLIKADYLRKFYKDNSQNVFDKVIKDIISEYGVDFKMLIFEDDIHKLDILKKNDKISFNILKFISTSDNIEFVRQKRPCSMEDIITFCKSSKEITIVSGSEKILAYAVLNGIKSYIPKEYIRQTPNPLKGHGVVVIDSNIASERDINTLCSGFSTIAISDVQLKEIGMSGYFAKICAYYGIIKRIPIVEESNDRTIVEFAKQVNADMFFSKDYGCIAFAKMQGVPCTLVKNKIHSDSTAVELIQQAKNSNVKYEGKDITLDFEKCQLKKGSSRFVINNFCIEFKNSMYRSCSTVEDGGYIFLKSDNLAIQIKIIDKKNKIGKLISIRRIK